MAILTFGGHVGVLDDKDPTGAERLKEWADGLRELPPGTPPTFEFQRMIHPGMVPADGDGLLAADGQGVLEVPGEHIQSVTVLHYGPSSCTRASGRSLSPVMCSRPSWLRTVPLVRVHV